MEFEENDFVEFTPRILAKKTRIDIENRVNRRINVDDVITTHKTMCFMNVRVSKGRSFAQSLIPAFSNPDLLE